ncbi:MAG: lytic transglycosylase domain-containing protein [Candidatus Eremiobacterota bacterium]
MSIYDRMSSIELKLQQLEAKMGQTSYIMQSGQPARVQSGVSQSAEGVTFENLINSLTDDKRFTPAQASKNDKVGSWNGDPRDFDSMIKQASRTHNVDESLIRAVIKQESAYDPKATSHCGAMGLMQLMPETAADLGVADAYDPYQNIMGGTKYLRQLLDRFNGNMTRAIAGYNAGPGAVEQHGGIPPYPETQNYVACVLEFYQRYKQGGQSSF